MLTINAEIKKNGLRSDGTYNVKLRFTLDRKMRRLATSLFATSKDLTKDCKIKQSSPIKQEVDSLIRSYQEKCAKLQVELNHYTIDEIMDYLDGEYQKQQTIDFIKFSREWIASTTIKGAPNYTTAINALVRFIGKEELDVNLITTNFLENFKAFLNKEREARTKKLTKALNQAVKRNIDRFPKDFMFQLTNEETQIWRSQFVTSNSIKMGVRRNPYAFTELGVAMLSSVLNSKTAIQINMGIMRAFVAVRQMIALPKTDKFAELQNEIKELKDYIEDVFADYNDINDDTRMQLELINQTLAELQTKKKLEEKPHRRIGFIQHDE